jgi:hypothetical protein
MEEKETSKHKTHLYELTEDRREKTREKRVKHVKEY